MSPRLFMAALALIALVAALLTPPHLVQLTLGTPAPAEMPLPLSRKPSGVAEVLDYAGSHGARVAVGYLSQLNQTVKGSRSLLVYIPDPNTCPPDTIAELRSTLQAIASQGVPVAVLVTGMGRCSVGIVENLVPGLALVTVERAEGLGVGVYRCRGLHYFVFNSFTHLGFSTQNSVEARLLAVGLTAELERPTPLGYLFATPAGVTVASLASEVFTNRLLNVSETVGLNGGRAFLELAECLAGAGPMIFVPLDFYAVRATVRVVSIYVDPGAAIASGLYQLEEAEHRLLRLAETIPPVLFALAGAAVLAVALALPPLRQSTTRGGMGHDVSGFVVGLLERLGILYGERAVRAVEKAWVEAETVLRALEGVGVEEAARGRARGSLFEAAVRLQKLRRRVRGRFRLVRVSEVETVRRLVRMALEGRTVERDWSGEGGAAG